MKHGNVILVSTDGLVWYERVFRSYGKSNEVICKMNLEDKKQLKNNIVIESEMAKTWNFWAKLEK